MIEEQTIEPVTPAALVARVAVLKAEGYRLVQMCATTLPESIQVDYSFDRDYRFLNLRLVLPREGGEVPSVTGVYGGAFAYENEIHDLFGLRFPGLNVDFKGHFYKIAVPHPFAPAVAPAAAPDPAATAPKGA